MFYLLTETPVHIETAKDLSGSSGTYRGTYTTQVVVPRDLPVPDLCMVAS